MTPSLGANGWFWGKPRWTRLYPPEAGPGGFAANLLTISAQPAQACTFIVEGGFPDESSHLWVMTDRPGYPVPPPEDPQSWFTWQKELGRVDFTAGQADSAVIDIGGWTWVRVSVRNGSTAQGPVQVTELFGEQ